VKKRVLGVGNCSFDHGNLEALITANFDAEMSAADSHGEALAMLASDGFDLVLINRKLAFDNSDGVELIERIKADPRLDGVPVMLLSNYPWAQRAAIAAGAHPGFGKAELDRTEAAEKLAGILNS